MSPHEAPPFSSFSNASIWKLPLVEGSPAHVLGFSRAYSLSLAPQLIYARSNLVPALISSRVYRQLEFLAVGSWWILHKGQNAQDAPDSVSSDSARERHGLVLQKIPGSREDVFADKSIDNRSTRSLMRVLKLAASIESYSVILDEWGEQPFVKYLTHIKLDAKLQAPLLALTLATDAPSKTTVAEAFPKLHRHLTSIGIFGPGFGAVIPKWGGLAEVAQVACRAGAVGGGVYVLNKRIQSITGGSVTPDVPAASLSTINLSDGDMVKARWIIGTPSTLPNTIASDALMYDTQAEVTHLTAIISHPLPSLFQPPAEGSPSPAGVVVVLPPTSLRLPEELAEMNTADIPPVNLIIHSSDTGECPEGQSIIYASTSSLLDRPSASALLLSSAVDTFLSTFREEGPEILWSMTYTRHYSRFLPRNRSPPKGHEQDDHGLLYLNDLSPSLALEDDVMRDVREVWDRVMGTTDADDDNEEAVGRFMVFDDREGGGGDGEGEEI
ncbi:MAG: hypothetical protein Q9220_000097 [cf. Caloplaca sp. 1 TL-2023]